MSVRSLLVAVLLSLPALTVVGCGNSNSDATDVAGPGTMSPADVAKAEAEVEAVNDEERAYQSQNPVGAPSKKR